MPDLDDVWLPRYGLAFRHPDFERYPHLLSPVLRGSEFARAKRMFPALRPAAYRFDHQLFGYAHGTVGFLSARFPKPDWQLLGSFSSDRKVGFGWGDGHPLFWYIQTADLSAGRFDDTRADDG